jgi:flagellum-specific peptidoglycan hydrolase FlgJ
MPSYLSKPLLDASHAEDMRRQAATLSTQVQQAQPPPTPDPVEEAPPLDWGSHIKSLLATWQDTPDQGGAPWSQNPSRSSSAAGTSPTASASVPYGQTTRAIPGNTPDNSSSPMTSPFDLSAHIQSLLAPWRDEKPTTSQGAEPSTPSSTGLPPSISAPYADRVPTPSGTPAPMPTGTPPAGPVDNSSRESFIRTAYPQALAAADGDPVLAQQLLATAISENGKVGTGRSLGEMGNNVGGIQGVQGSAGSFTAMDAGRPRQFAAYNNAGRGIPRRA